MITHYPYFNSSYYRYYPNYYINSNISKKHIKENINNINKKNKIFDENKKEIPTDDRQYFDILGIRLYYDDILLIALILFLYTEHIEDQNLFICLILLLLS